MSSGTSEAPVKAALSASDVIAGKYRIDGVLGEGGMGIVYRGWHLTLETPVAIKVIRLELASRPDFAMRFVNEARSAARLRGQHIARVLDIGSLGDSFGSALYMVMELLDGSDLRSILDREGHLPPDRAIRYVLQACDALAEVHAAGIVHRDVKPDNLFLARESDDTEVMKLLDFGISKSIHGDGSCETREGLGSPLYMAPEQLTNAAEADARADVWSLGVVLYELLSGRVPFNGENVVRICAAVMDLEPEPLWRSYPHVSPALEAIVLRCLSKRPEGRFRTIRDLSLALRALQRTDCSEASNSEFDSRRGLSGYGYRFPGRGPEPESVPQRRGRRRTRPHNWMRRIALGASAAAIASGIPASTLLDAVAARGPVRPKTVQGVVPWRAELPPPAQCAPVVCPVPEENVSDLEPHAARGDGAARAAVHGTGARVSAGRGGGIVRRNKSSASGTGVSATARASRPSSSERVTKPVSAYRLVQPYGIEPDQDAEAEPDQASGGNALDLADLDSIMLKRVYGHAGR